jgi:hypothetical protein
MATVDVKIRRYTGNGWDILHPETVVDQLLDTTAVGKSLLKLSNPAGTAFVKVDGTGNVTLIDAATLKDSSHLNAANKTHTHETDEISDGNSVNLTTIISRKADLENGFIKADQIPSYLFGGLKFSATVGANTTLEALVASLIGSTDQEREGSYIVATSDITLTSATGHTIQAPGDEGDNVLPVDIEAGDWIIYLGSNLWAIKNNTYPLATTSSKGVVQLSAGTATSRSQLSDSTSLRGTRVMDETATKKVIRNIFYQTGTTPTGLAGDLWFDGSF